MRFIPADWPSLFLPSPQDVLFGTLLRRYAIDESDPLQLSPDGVKAFRQDMIRYSDTMQRFKDQERLMVAFILEQVGPEAKIALRSFPIF